MKKSLFLLFFVSSFIQAQYTVKGNIGNANKYASVFLYKIEGSKQLYLQNAQIQKQNNNGTFEFKLTSDTKPGVYRAIYDLRQRNSYVEFLFNKENIEVTFNPANKEATPVFNQSKENKLYNRFLKDISSAQYLTDSLQRVYLKNPSQATAVAYRKAVTKVDMTQKSYEKKAIGTLAYHFIKATKRYNSSVVIKDTDLYFKGALSHFFDNIDFNNQFLYNSSFLVDRITDYIFYMNYSENRAKQDDLHKKAIDVSMSKLTNVSFKTDVIEYLISTFATYKKTQMVDYIFTNYFNKLPKANQSLEFKQQIMETMKTAIGNIAPDFSWEENGRMMSLSKLKDGQNYLLIFYSTGCPHCLREVPEVFTFLKGKTKTKVVAFAMETSEIPWKNYKKTLPGWHHVLGLNKWENKIARTYQINSTPTYFVLGKDKKILGNPETIKELKVILKGLN
mgnify:FL=1